MNYDYCQSCGNKIEYLLQKPNFCPSCGCNLQTATTAQASAPARIPPSRERSVDDPDGTDVFELPSLGKLQYTVDADYGAIAGRRLKLGEVLGSNAQPGQIAEETPSPIKNPNPSSSKKKTAPSKPTAQQQFEAVKGTIEECKSSQGKIIDVGEEG